MLEYNITKSSLFTVSRFSVFTISFDSGERKGEDETAIIKREERRASN
jgi:hypothetical protein